MPRVGALVVNKLFGYFSSECVFRIGGGGGWHLPTLSPRKFFKFSKSELDYFQVELCLLSLYYQKFLRSLASSLASFLEITLCVSLVFLLLP